MTAPLFPELVAVVEPLPVPCRTPLFVLGYRPNLGGWGCRWKIWFPLDFADANDPRLAEEIQQLQDKGWTHITVLKLPAGGPWSDVVG